MEIGRRGHEQTEADTQGPKEPVAFHQRLGIQSDRSRILMWAKRTVICLQCLGESTLSITSKASCCSETREAIHRPPRDKQVTTTILRAISIKARRTRVLAQIVEGMHRMIGFWNRSRVSDETSLEPNLSRAQSCPKRGQLSSFTRSWDSFIYFSEVRNRL